MAITQATRQHAANRFGLGACARDLAAIGDDPRGWLQAQLRPAKAEAVATQPAAAAIAEALARRRERNAQRARTPSTADREAREDEARNQRNVVSQETLARLRLCVRTATPLRERLVHFWSNHFTVSRIGKPPIAAACTAFEQEAIRSHLDGNFRDMLRAVETHPVMLIYLDNAQSTGPNSRAGRRRNVGLNENLAREILELHTLGVDGGYTPADVAALARVLTGWTLASPRLPVKAPTGSFVFADFMHEPGDQTLLGTTYEDAGVDQGLRALDALARHASTHRHLASKLVRHFVADEPPANAVDQLARVFASSDGHLPSVHAALIDIESGWDASNRKLKTPHELLVSAWRALEPDDYPPAALLNPLRTLNHLPFTAPSPAGWPDVAAHWASPDMLRQRLAWGIAVGSRLGGAHATPRLLPTLFDAERDADLLAAIGNAESRGQALASPAFQWR